MAFSKLTLNPGASPGARGKAPVVHTYSSSDDTLATIVAATYMLNTGDVMYINGSDGSRWVEITSSSGAVTVVPIGDDLVVLTDRIVHASHDGRAESIKEYPAIDIWHHGIRRGGTTGVAAAHAMARLGHDPVIMVGINLDQTGIVDMLGRYAPTPEAKSQWCRVGHHAGTVRGWREEASCVAREHPEIYAMSGWAAQCFGGFHGDH
jgi:hypothetical protein